ncbi:MAG: glycosyltransferase [Bacteroidia bacterium]|nr:glycosyltransferase [Bacteroidia bacterium]
MILKAPVVSIITITWNNLEGLKKTFESVVSQTALEHIEFIIIDGGSKDGSAEFLKQNETKISYWQSEKDKGIYDAMNIGLTKCSGDYVWFLNAGDYAFSNDTLRQVLPFMEASADVIYGETMLVSPEGKHLGSRSHLTTRKLPHTLTWKGFNKGMSVGHQSILVKKSIAVPYDTEYKYVADIDWVINCLKLAGNVINSGQTIACFTVDGFSTTNRNASNKQRYEVLKKHFGFFPNLINHAAILARKIFHNNN